MKTFLSIQYLRGLAAFLVVCVHVNSTALLSFGGSGVDIFFVISGFIMWTITAARESSPRTFATRRLLRIVPLYWAFTLLLAGASLLVPAAFPNLRFSVGELVASLAFFPVYNTTNGFARPVLQQGWSLNCEMLFYVIMAAALLFGRGVRALIVVGTLLALVAAGQLLPAGIAAVEIWATPLLLEFVAGIAIAALVAANRLPNPVLATACIFASLVGYLVAFLYSGPEGPPLRVVAWGVPSALLVLAMLTLEQRTRFLQNRLLQLIGDASYSIYLTHSFAISLTSRG